MSFAAVLLFRKSGYCKVLDSVEAVGQFPSSLKKDLL